VDKFYDMVIEDKSIGPMFSQRNMNIQRKMQKRYICHILSGSQYNGRSLKATHAKYEITHDDMDKAKELLGMAFLSLGIEQQLVEEILLLMEPSRKDIVTVQDPEDNHADIVSRSQELHV
jgi:hemoglobin